MIDRTGFDYAEPIRERGFHATRGVCDACGKPLPKRRRRWCSDRCANVISNHLTPRISAMTTDHGVCQVCGIDANVLRERVRILLGLASKFPSPRWVRVRDQVTKILIRHGWPTVFDRDWWDADHIVPLWEGGAHAPSNIQTLCVPCHKAKIRWEAKRRASQNRARLRRQARQQSANLTGNCQQEATA